MRTDLRRDHSVWFMELSPFCDQCGHSRAHGNHQACSKKRQAMHAARRARHAEERSHD